MTKRLEEMLRKEPFEPFRIILTSGTQYDVLSPWMLAIGQTEISYYFPKSDRLAHLRINQLAALETIQQNAA
jgi:hypothetical protein